MKINRCQEPRGVTHLLEQPCLAHEVYFPKFYEMPVTPMSAEVHNL